MDRCKPVPSARLTATLAALALATAALPAAAAETVLRLDPKATDVSFEVPATGHDVHGLLRLAAGEVRFDPDTGEAAGTITVDARSADTGNDSRDETLHQKVFESEIFPSFVFTAERVEGALPEAGKGEVRLHGTMRIHGADHPMMLPANVEVSGDEVSATTTFDVPYVAWGMHNPSILFLRVADSVAVTVRAGGRLSAGAGESEAGSGAVDR
jgi:polyisoprenoid-binding protein YceI